MNEANGHPFRTSWIPVAEHERLMRAARIDLECEHLREQSHLRNECWRLRREIDSASLLVFVFGTFSAMSLAVVLLRWLAA
jgi:hypothetical protein